MRRIHPVCHAYRLHSCSSLAAAKHASRVLSIYSDSWGLGRGEKQGEEVHCTPPGVAEIMATYTDIHLGAKQERNTFGSEAALASLHLGAKQERTKGVCWLSPPCSGWGYPRC